jgi:siroheme synthase-like protein
MTLLARRPVVAPAGARDAAAPAFGFPIFLEVRDRAVLVCGGGREAAHKARALAQLGARVRVWAADHDSTAGLAGDDRIELFGGPFDVALLDDAIVAIVATGDRAKDRTIAGEARSRRVLVNTVDDIPFCDWSAPAILRRGNLTLAVGTGGVAPALAVRLRDRLAGDLGTEYGTLLEIFGDVRPRIMASGRSFADRRRLWYDLVDGAALDALAVGDEAGARRIVNTAIAAWEAER